MKSSVLKYSTLIKCPIVDAVVVVSIAAIKKAFISLAVMYFFLSLSVAGILKKNANEKICLGYGPQDDEAKFFSSFVCNVCIWHTIASIERINECVDMLLLPMLLFFFLSFCAGTFKVINDIFGRTIKRRIIYFSFFPYCYFQCLFLLLLLLLLYEETFFPSILGAFYCILENGGEQKVFQYDHYQHVRK